MSRFTLVVMASSRFDHVAACHRWRRGTPGRWGDHHNLPHRTPGASSAISPCRAAVVAPGSRLRDRGHPPAPSRDQVWLAEAAPCAAGTSRSSRSTGSPRTGPPARESTRSTAWAGMAEADGAGGVCVGRSGSSPIA